MPYTTRLSAAALLAAAIGALAAGCSGNSMSSTTTSTGVCTASTTSPTITIANNAVCPQNITVPRGSQVTFVNNDSQTHEMASDPHPEHTDCPEINQVGNLVAGQTRQTGNLNIARRCGFHDHINFDNKNMQGSITIQ